MGYDLKQYGTIVVVTPTMSGCYWAGRATLSNRCQAGVFSANSPPCTSANLMCVQFVIGHELGTVVRF